MKSLKRYVSGLVLLLAVNIAFAQDFKSDLEKLDAQIEVAYKSKEITELEYDKLKNEENTIQLAVEKANADNVVTQDEKNKIYSKIIRFRKQLVKLKNDAGTR